MKDTLKKDWPIAAIAALFAALGILYSVVTPIFEASDEFHHYPVVAHIASTGRLPVQQPGVATLWEQEGSQPPLYYAIGAGLTGWIDTSDLESVHQLNPHAKPGVPLDADNKNLIVHTDAERAPWHGTALAVHVIRLFSVALGTASVILIYALALTIWPERRWLATLAAGIAAFNPMFLFITASVNNDNLTTTLATWTLLLCARIIREGLTPQRTATLAVVAALGALSKLSALTLYPTIGLVLILHGWRTKRWREAVAAGVAVGAVWLALAGWWYARNLRLYSELFGTRTMVAVAGGREPITLATLPGEWYGFWIAFWGLFGGVNVLMDPLVYRFYNALSWLAVAGLIWWMIRTVPARSREAMIIPAVLAVQVAITFAGVARWTMATYASQGRLMFPVMGAVAALMALGLIGWVPPRWRAVGTGVVFAPMAIIAAIAPFRYIAPAYAPPPVVQSVPEGAVPAGLTFDGIEIVAIGTQGAAVEEGGYVPVTVYLRANEPVEERYSLYLHALGRGYEEIGKVDAYPGGGNLPTTGMMPGAIYEDSYRLPLDAAFEAPTLVRVAVGIGLRTGDDYTTLTGAMPDGGEAANVIVNAGVAYPADPAACLSIEPGEGTVLAALGGFARLAAERLDLTAAPGDAIPVALVLDHAGDTPIDWTVFVHLANEAGEVVTQADGQPLDGDYPTSFWRRSCGVEDVHPLMVPPDAPEGTYTVLAGMYDAADPAFTRAEAVAPDGTPYPNNAVPLGTIRVEGP